MGNKTKTELQKLQATHPKTKWHKKQQQLLPSLPSSRLSSRLSESRLGTPGKTAQPLSSCRPAKLAPPSTRMTHPTHRLTWHASPLSSLSATPMVMAVSTLRNTELSSESRGLRGPLRALTSSHPQTNLKRATLSSTRSPQRARV